MNGCINKRADEYPPSEAFRREVKKRGEEESIANLAIQRDLISLWAGNMLDTVVKPS